MFSLCKKKTLANGELLVICKSEGQQKKTLLLKSLNKCALEVYVPGGNNRVKGVIYGVPVDIKISEIVQKIKKGQVIDAKCFQVMRNGKKIDSQTVLWTFNSDTVLKELVWATRAFR